MLSEVERFVNWTRRRSPEARTWKDYGYDLRIFIQVVGDRPLKDITFRDIDHFVGVQCEKGFKPSTINRRLAAVISLYGFLLPEDEELVCPVIVRRHHVRDHQRLPRPVDEESLKRFFAVIPCGHNVTDKRDRAMFLLMLRCGLRIGEVAALRLVDLFLEEDYPRIVVRGKGSRERGVYLSRQAEIALKEYLAERPSVKSEFVFLSYLEDGLSTTAIHKRLMRYREEAQIQISAHRLRHSFANDLLNADAPITSIQKLMGHRWIESTQTYVMANDKEVCADYYAACEKLEGWTDPSGRQYAHV
jgi:site-specific recombinase XerD